jgi:hypothetical protein
MGFIGETSISRRRIDARALAPPDEQGRWRRNVLSHRLRCIFVHVPKTGGWSVDSFFLEHFGMGWEANDLLLVGKNEDSARGPRNLMHLKASEYLSCGHVTQDQFREYFKFAFVRNPWDRAVSEYKFRDYPRKFDFKTFLFKHCAKSEATEGENRDMRVHRTPQYQFLYDEEGNSLVDFIGRYERLASDFATVAERLNLGGKELPHYNRSIDLRWTPTAVMLWLKDPAGMYRLRRNLHHHYTEYYDDESRELIARFYRRDIELFGYKFGS